MLKWKIENADDGVEFYIEQTKKSFDKWFEKIWKDKVDKEIMLSEKSPVKDVYYAMSDMRDKLKSEYHYMFNNKCSSCRKEIDSWIASDFNCCSDYDCCESFVLCKKCAKELKTELDKFIEE